MITLKNARLADIPTLLDLWNINLGEDFPLTEKLLRQTMENDPYYESEGHLIAWKGETAVGWILCKSMKNAGAEVGRFAGRGGIGALCVHPDFQRQGIGTQLLQAAENHLTANGSPLTLLYYPHHFLPGVPVQQTNAISFFEKHGYNFEKECADMVRDLNDYHIPPKVLLALEKNPTVEIRPAYIKEAQQIIDMVAQEFPGGWTYSTKGHFARGQKASDFIVAVENSQVIGFCHTADFNSPWLIANTYWFPLFGKFYGGLGPLGIAKEHRKRGLGLAIVALAVEDLKKRGVQRMCIDWTTLTDFYGKLGFEVWKRYRQATEKSY